MIVNWIDRIGDWNPQLLREFKGRLKTRNVLIALAISALGQFLLFQSFLSQLPIKPLKYESDNYPIYNRLCTGPIDTYRSPLCIVGADGNFDINWALWNQDVFATLSIIGIFVLLVAGTYMIVGDLAYEERRGTLNFIRLSPQSSQSLLVGKLLGVPVLLYLVALLAVPFHLSSGISAGISLGAIAGFYAVSFAGCAFFYSAALLFSLFGSKFSGFQPYLGSALALMFLWVAAAKPITQDAMDWLNLFSPSTLIPYLVNEGSKNSSFLGYLNLEKLQFFYLPLGASVGSLICLALVNYGLWTYWIWQGLERRFHNPSKTILSKGQSYLLVACIELSILGFVLQDPRNGYYDLQSRFFMNLTEIAFYNAIVFFGLMAILSPHRQILQDWARYRREKTSDRQSFWNRSLVQNLIWGEKSPAILAMALNVAIATTIMSPWILLWPTDNVDKIRVVFGIAFFVGLIMIYASLAQLMLLMKTSRRSIWATGTIGAVVFLPPLVLGVLRVDPYTNADIWLFSTLPWVGIEKATMTTLFVSLIGQFSIVTLLNVQLKRQLKKAGESASKALLEGRA